jgi:hypothetical protein
LNARVTHRSGRHQTAINTRLLTTHVDDITSARALMVEGRHGLDVTRRFQVFGDASYARDRFAGIDDRVAAGAGGAYTLSAPARQTFTLEGGLGWTLERRLRLDTQQSEPQARSWGRESDYEDRTCQTWSAVSSGTA